MKRKKFTSPDAPTLIFGILIVASIILTTYYLNTEPEFIITKEVCEEIINEETHVLAPESSNDFDINNFSFKIEDYKINDERVHSSVCYSSSPPNISKDERYFLEDTYVIDNTIYCIFNIISLEGKKILKEDGWYQEIKKYDTIRKESVPLNLIDELKGDRRLSFDFDKVYIEKLWEGEQTIYNENPYFDVLVTIFENQTTCRDVEVDEIEYNRCILRDRVGNTSECREYYKENNLPFTIPEGETCTLPNDFCIKINPLKQELTIDWLDLNCEYNTTEYQNKCYKAKDGHLICQTPDKYFCGNYTIEVK